ISDYVPYYRVASCVNNQLGSLHNLLMFYRPWVQHLNVEPFKDEPCSNNIYHYDNVVPLPLAQKCRQFLNDIIFDPNKPLMNDITNLPNDNVYNDLRDRYLATEAVLNATYDPLKWVWEKYNFHFFRASPLTKEAFVGSPIVELLDYLRHKFYYTKDFKKYNVETWVIQLIPVGSDIGWHMDDNGDRKIAF